MGTNEAAPAVKTAVVLAGGLGTRLRSVVSDVPKPMAPVSGRPFLAHLLDYWIGQGIGQFVISTGYMHQKISEYFGERYSGCPVRYAVEEEPLGTGGGLLHAAASVRDEQAPLLVINGDTFFQVPLGEFAAFHAGCAADWTFALFSTDDSQRYMGLQLADDGRVLQLGARMPDARQVLANGGVYLVNPAVLARIRVPQGSRVSLEDELLPSIMRAGGKLCGRPFSGTFIDIGVPDDYGRASQVISSATGRNATT